MAVSICPSLCRSSCPCPPQQRGRALGWGCASLCSNMGRDRSMRSWKEETPAEYINIISYLILFKSCGLPGVAKGAAVPSQLRRLLERNSIASKVWGLPGQGTCPQATGRQEAEESSASPCRSDSSSCSTKGGFPVCFQ